MKKPEERWRELCAQAAVEHDPQKLMALVLKSSRLLGEKHDHPKSKTEEAPDKPRDPKIPP